MVQLIRMPEVMAGAAEAAIQTWLVAPGAAVAEGQPLAEIETDKAVVEFSAEVSGTVGRLLAAEGDSVAVGAPIVALVSAGETATQIDAALAAEGVDMASAAQLPPAPQSGDMYQDAPPPSPSSSVSEHAPEPAPAAGRTRVFASPLVRRLAADRGVDVAAISGTGPNGRVVRRDLERHLEAMASALPAEPAVPAEPAHVTGTGYEDVPADRMRRAIARRLTESKATVPHFYLTADCRVDALLALRAEVNVTATRRISVNDFVVKAVAGALAEVPEANAIWNGDSIRRYSSVDVAVAVATDTGLLTPVVRGVERMPLTQVSETVAELAERARAGRLRQQELEGGSFSVSNLGMYGTAQFSAILNPPQSGILAVGAARKAPVVDADQKLVVADVMTVTLSADHRVLDGAVAALWLAAFQRRIENPLTILI